jgi:DNA-binding CsgD family transcriptional regulator
MYNFSMLTEKIKELEAAKAKVKDLEDKILAERPFELAELPEKYGFASLADFIKAVKASYSSKPAAKAKRGRKPGKAVAKKAAPAKEAKSRTRAVITEETRTQVKDLVAAGKSGAEIAKSLGISLPSVQNIKKALGLVKSKAVAAPAVEAPAAEAAPAQ